MNRVSRIIAGIFMLAIVTTACGDEYSTGNDSTQDTVAGDSNDGSTPDLEVPAPEASEEIIKMLTVTTVDLAKCLTLTGAEDVGVVSYNIGALELPVPQGPRLWSDAISVPLTETEPLKQLSETLVSICEDPLLGATWGHFFSQMEVGGRKLIDLNPWLETFDVPEVQINDVAMGFIPLLDVVGDPSDELKEEAVEKAVEWQVLAAKVNTLMERIIVLWEDDQQSLIHYHLTAGGLVVGELPEIGINPDPESETALMMVIMEKGACVPLKVIGINVGDRRPEEFAPPACETPTPSVPGQEPPVTTTPSGTVPPVTTTPGHTVPSTTVPSGTVPPTTVPGTTLPPGTTVPGTTTTTTVHGVTTTTVPCVPPRVLKNGRCENPPPSPTIPPAPVHTGAPTTTIGPSPTAPTNPTPTGPVNTVNPPVVTVPSNTGGNATPGVTIPPTTAPLPTTPPATIPRGPVVSD